MSRGSADHFSRQAAEYAQYRPGYPKELFSYLSSLARGHQLAIDCATGNGQAAIGLAGHFAHVVAFDSSADQIARAFAHPRVEYRVGAAEQLQAEPQSADLIAVAQALHWFNIARFYAEVRRVAKPGGILAVWTYNICRITPQVDAVVRNLHDTTLGPYWPAERRLVIDEYRGLPFPFEEITGPAFELTTHWTLAHLMGYLRSWSATQRYLEATGKIPFDLMGEELAAAWERADEARQVTWPLTLRVGRVGGTLA